LRSPEFFGKKWEKMVEYGIPSSKLAQKVGNEHPAPDSEAENRQKTSLNINKKI